MAFDLSPHLHLFPQLTYYLQLICLQQLLLIFAVPIWLHQWLAEQP